MSDIECVFESMAGKGSIFISNYAAAQDIALLHSKGIRAILSVARSGLVQHSREDIPYYLYLPAEDHEEYELYRFFNRTFEFLEQARRHCNVLVHCMAGVSRSVTIVIAYLLKKFKCSLGEVIMMLQRRRSKINPNKGFIEQLKKYAQQEGLPCNFDHQEVPSARDRSASRGHSRSKEDIAQFALPTPAKASLHKKHKIQVEKIQGQKTAANVAESKKEAAEEDPDIPSPPRMQKIESAVVNSPEKLLEEGIQLRKQCSFDSRGSPRKKMSIEEKISKVREKIYLKEEQRRVSVEKQQPLDKENKTAAQPDKKTPSKHLSEYFSLYTRNHALALNLRPTSPAKHSLSPRLQLHQLQDCLCETEEDVRPREQRAESRLSSKLRQKKASRERPCP